MAYVKLDTGILDSTLWMDRPAREAFITALLMATPIELKEPLAQLRVDELAPTGWQVPPGWYGFVASSGPGIVRRAGLDAADGLVALARLGAEDPESRSQAHGGRRLARVDGGFVILNYMAYRDKDHGAAERQRRLRERKKALAKQQPSPETSQFRPPQPENVTRDSNAVTRDNQATKPVDVTESRVTSRDEAVTSRIADAYADAEKNPPIPPVPRGTEDERRQLFLRFMSAYPKGLYRGPARLRAERVFYRLLDDEEDPEEMIEGAERYKAQQRALNKIGSQFIMNPDKFLLERDWDDEFALPPDPAQQAAEERDARQQADMDRVRAWAVGKGCPYRPHDHETAALFETRVRSWLNHEGRPETGTGPARATIQPPARRGAT